MGDFIFIRAWRKIHKDEEICVSFDQNFLNKSKTLEVLGFCCNCSICGSEGNSLCLQFAQDAHKLVLNRPVPGMITNIFRIAENYMKSDKKRKTWTKECRKVVAKYLGVKCDQDFNEFKSIHKKFAERGIYL